VCAACDALCAPVEHDVDGSHVSRFPPEELAEVDHLQCRRHPDAVDKPEQLVVLQYRPTHTRENLKRGGKSVREKNVKIGEYLEKKITSKNVIVSCTFFVF